MDDLLGDEEQVVSEEEAIVATPPVEVTQNSDTIPNPITSDPLVQQKEEIIEQKEPVQIKKPLPTIAPKKSLVKSLAMAAAGLFGVVVIGFVVMTMFPAGIDGSNSQEPIVEEILVQEPVTEEPVEEHAAAEPKTPQEVARTELVNYSSLGEEYYTL